MGIRGFERNKENNSKRGSEVFLYYISSEIKEWLCEHKEVQMQPYNEVGKVRGLALCLQGDTAHWLSVCLWLIATKLSHLIFEKMQGIFMFLLMPEIALNTFFCIVSFVGESMKRPLVNVGYLP